MTDVEKRRSLLEKLRALKADHEAKCDALYDDGALSDEEYDERIKADPAGYRPALAQLIRITGHLRGPHRAKRPDPSQTARKNGLNGLKGERSKSWPRFL